MHYSKETKNILLLTQQKICKKFLCSLSSLLANTSFGHIVTNNIFDNLAPVKHKLTKSNASIFIAYNKDILTIGRTHNDEFIDVLEFTVQNYTNLIDYELNARYFLVFIGENDKRVENLFIDIFGYKGKEIAISEVKNMLVIQKNDEKYNFVLKNAEKVLFEFNITLNKKWHCEEDVFENACCVVKKKKQKNIDKNDMGDVIGKLHMEKQDLKELQLKKARKVKHNE